MKKFVVVCLAAVLIAGCSIKEMRDDCPCRLILDFSRIDTMSVKEALIYAVDEVGTVYGDVVPASLFMPEYEMDVMRSRLRLNVCSGDGGMYDPGKGLVIPYGEECPEIWMHSSELDADSEVVRDTVELRKSHCVLTVIVEKDDSPVYGMCIKGNVSGYDVDGEPFVGPFSYIPVESGLKKYRAVIPRQKDASLILEVDDGSEVIKRFALGELISAGGYDWTAPDLEDLTVHIDWALTDILITIKGWDWIYEYEIVI